MGSRESGVDTGESRFRLSLFTIPSASIRFVSFVS